MSQRLVVHPLRTQGRAVEDVLEEILSELQGLRAELASWRQASSAAPAEKPRRVANVKVEKKGEILEFDLLLDGEKQATLRFQKIWGGRDIDADTYSILANYEPKTITDFGLEKSYVSEIDLKAAVSTAWEKWVRANVWGL